MPLVTISSNISEALKKHEVVPEVVDEFSPQGLITVTYDKATEVSMGNTLKPSETQTRPSVKVAFTEERAKDPNATYTLVLTDPDAPTKGDKKWSEFCHYLVSGIKLDGVQGDAVSDVTEIDCAKANELVSYMGPAPPENTGKHRYVFVLYKEGAAQPKSGLADRPNWGTGKPGSGAKDYANKNSLTPVAINFFYAQNEKSA